MATGDSADLLRRLKTLIPGAWFADIAPIRDAVLGGIGDTLSWLYGFITFTKSQTRLSTASAPFIDIAALDFIGPNFPRFANETDSQYSLRIRKEVLRARQTRAGISQALVDLTGTAPIIVEPWNPNDTAVWDIQSYYGCQGVYGSLILPYQIFITAYRPPGTGIPNIWGYDYNYYGAYVGRYVNISEVAGRVTDSDIYAAIARNIAAGITAWVQILNAPVPVTGTSFKLDYSNPGNSQYHPGLM